MIANAYKWCLVEYLHPPDHTSARIREVDKMDKTKLAFKVTKFPIKVVHIQKIERKEAFLVMKTKKKIKSNNVSKNTFK